MNRNALAGVAMAVTAAALPASEQIVFQQGANGYAGTGDASIFSDFAGNASGQDVVLYVGTQQFGPLRRALIRFDVSVIPSGAIVETVELELAVERARTGAELHELRRATADWGEGPAVSTDAGAGGTGVAAQAGDATWSAAAFPSTLWSSAGGDFASTPSATATFGSAGTDGAFTGSGLVEDVQAWVADPSSNRGWFLLGNETALWNAKRFHSSEATAGAAPKLTVTFRVPSAASDTWMLLE